VTVMTAAGILKTTSVETASLTAMSGMAMNPARVYGPPESVTGLPRETAIGRVRSLPADPLTGATRYDCLRRTEDVVHEHSEE
jgi:hypothetical protein